MTRELLLTLGLISYPHVNLVEIKSSGSESSLAIRLHPCSLLSTFARQRAAAEMDFMFWVLTGQKHTHLS